MNRRDFIGHDERYVADERAGAVDNQDAESSLRCEFQIAVAGNAPEGGIGMHRIGVRLASSPPARGLRYFLGHIACYSSTGRACK